MKYPYQYSGVEFSLYISVYIAGKDHEFLGDVFVDFEEGEKVSCVDTRVNR